MVDAHNDAGSVQLGSAHMSARDAYRNVPILKGPTWNHEVAAYFFFGGMSAGAAMIGSLADLVGGERNTRLARTAHFVSFATLLPCPPLLIDDLGYPARFHHMMRVFKPSSPMNLGSWALLVHGAGAAVTVARMLASEGRPPFVGSILCALPERLLAILGLPSSFVLAGYTGVLLGTTSIPVWYKSPLLGALFMASSFSTGAGATSLVGLVTHRHESHTEHTELALLSLTAGIFEAALVGGYVATTGEPSRHVTGGPVGPLFKAAAATLGASLLLEVGGILLGDRGGKAFSVMAGVATVAGGALLRWSIVRAGRASARDREGTVEAMKPREGSPGWWRV